MDWNKLAELINKMTPEERATHVAIVIDGEVYSGVNANLLINKNLCELDDSHPYLEIS